MQQKDVSLIVILLLLLSGFYLLRPEGSVETRRERQVMTATQSSETMQKIEKSIDQNMKIGRQTEELRRDLTAIQNKMAPAIDLAKIDPGVFDPEAPLSLKTNADDAAVKAYRDAFERPRGRRESELTPEQRITSKIGRDQWEREYRQAYEKEYMKAYVENARKAGYEVTLGGNGEIVGVVDIGTNEPVRFPQSVDESGKKPTGEGSK